jgi:hypothetical protein
MALRNAKSPVLENQMSSLSGLLKNPGALANGDFKIPDLPTVGGAPAGGSGTSLDILKNAAAAAAKPTPKPQAAPVFPFASLPPAGLLGSFPQRPPAPGPQDILAYRNQLIQSGAFPPDKADPVLSSTPFLQQGLQPGQLPVPPQSILSGQ